MRVQPILTSIYLFESRKRVGLFEQHFRFLALDVRTRWHQIRSKFSKKVKRAVAEGDDLERLKEDKLAFLIPFTKHAADGK